MTKTDALNLRVEGKTGISEHDRVRAVATGVPGNAARTVDRMATTVTIADRVVRTGRGAAIVVVMIVGREVATIGVMIVGLVATAMTEGGPMVAVIETGHTVVTIVGREAAMIVVLAVTIGIGVAIAVVMIVGREVAMIVVLAVTIGIGVAIAVVTIAGPAVTAMIVAGRMGVTIVVSEVAMSADLVATGMTVSGRMVAMIAVLGVTIAIAVIVDLVAIRTPAMIDWGEHVMTPEGSSSAVERRTARRSQ